MCDSPKNSARSSRCSSDGISGDYAMEQLAKGSRTTGRLVITAGASFWVPLSHAECWKKTNFRF